MGRMRLDDRELDKRHVFEGIWTSEPTARMALAGRVVRLLLRAV